MQALLVRFFFRGSVNAERYIDMLAFQFIPSSSRIRQALPGPPIFQQDGAPAHFALDTRAFLNEHFPHRWIGRGCEENPWPPRSPDLTPLDLWLWGYLKALVFSTPVATVAVLEERIRASFRTITPEMCARAINEFERRLTVCVEREGWHVERRLAT